MTHRKASIYSIHYINNMEKFETELHLPNKNPKELPKMIPEKGMELKATKELSPESLAIVSDNTMKLSLQIQSSMEP
jgi:hypothetical protein